MVLDMTAAAVKNCFGNSDYRPLDMKSPEQQMSNVELQELCEHINSRNRAAQRAQRDSQTLFQTLYFKDKPMSDPKCVADAVIFSLRDNGFLVYIPQYAIKVKYQIKFSSHLCMMRRTKAKIMLNP